MPNLSPAEISDLARFEKTIEAGELTFVEVGLALTAIRDRKLYRKDFDTFEGYCFQKWGWTHRRGNQLIKAASVVQALPENLGKIVPNDSVARELSKTTPQKRQEVLSDLKEKKVKITAKSIRKSLSPEEQAEEDIREAGSQNGTLPPVDAHGVPITKEAMPYWERKAEVQELLTALTKVKSHLKKRHEEEDRLMGWIFEQASAHVTQAYTAITNAMPYAICLECEGHPELNKRCIHCHGTGLISKYAYEMYPNPTKRAFRLKSYGYNPA